MSFFCIDVSSGFSVTTFKNLSKILFFFFKIFLLFYIDRMLVISQKQGTPMIGVPCFLSFFEKENEYYFVRSNLHSMNQFSNLPKTLYAFLAICFSQLDD